MEFLKLTKTGLYCKTADFYLDPKHPVKNAVISHAHADHAVRGNRNVFCTPTTKLIMEKRYVKDAAHSFSVFDFSTTFELNGVLITFFPAGHIMGSAQVLMECEGKRYLYTGDYKTSEDASCEMFQVVKADVLITESTFADPAYSHPSSEIEISRLNNIENNILIGAYPVGKAQRLTSVINKHCPGKEIYIHPRIVAFHNMSASLGFDLGKWNHYPLDKENGRNSVSIVPPDVYKRYSNNKSFTKAFATGWDRKYYKGDFSLIISDHADWAQLLETISNSGAKEVYTVHGNGKKLVSHFSGSDILVKELVSN